MGWLLQCSDSACARQAWASNIVDLIGNHRDEHGWFRCECGKASYIEKNFSLQEAGEIWAPFLRGAIALGATGDSYQPFVFLVSYEPVGEVTDIWFSYYKDLRSSGGLLKLGHGPGGPPNLHRSDILLLLRQLIELGFLEAADLELVLTQKANPSLES
jgi:hypothetical protein